VRLARHVRHRLGRDEGQQARADVTVDVGLDVLGANPGPQRGVPASFIVAPSTVTARSCTPTPP
jgi:hypothetical protein